MNGYKMIAVALSGALVYDFQERKSVFCRMLSGDNIREIVNVAHQYDAMAHLLAENESIVRIDQVSHMVDFHMGIYQSMFLELTRKVEDMQAEAEHLGISMAETVGIGDADNDRAILEAAGLSVAMANGAEDIKALCDVVTADNDHNGVGKAIRKYCALRKEGF